MRIFVLILLLSSAILSCDDGRPNTVASERGNLGGKCFEDETCNKGFECVLNICNYVEHGKERSFCTDHKNCNDGLACINDICTKDSKEVYCNDNYAVPNGQVISGSKVEITYNRLADKWNEPKNCDFTCNENWNKNREINKCVKVMLVDCLPNQNKPENAVDIVVKVLVTSETGIVYSTPPECDWECAADFYQTEFNTCINKKEVPCNEDIEIPEKGILKQENVTITYTDENGWSEPQHCKFNCISHYSVSKDEKKCVLVKLVDCASNPSKPENAIDIVYKVFVESDDEGKTWSDPEICAEWKCKTDYFKDASGHFPTCINEKTVECSPNFNRPQNSKDNVEFVKVTYTTIGGWSTPAMCDWVCLPDYFQQENSCINKKEVDCIPDTSSPPDSQIIESKHFVVYDSINGWSPTPLCEWKCNETFKRVNNMCLQTCDDSLCSSKPSTECFLIDGNPECICNIGYEKKYNQSEDDFVCEKVVVEKQAYNLMWQMKKTEETYTFDEAESYCYNLSNGRYYDWRMPTIAEIRTLVQDNSDACTDLLKTAGMCEVDGHNINYNNNNCSCEESYDIFDTTTAPGDLFETLSKTPALEKSSDSIMLSNGRFIITNNNGTALVTTESAHVICVRSIEQSIDPKQCNINDYDYIPNGEKYFFVSRKCSDDQIIEYCIEDRWRTIYEPCSGCENGTFLSCDDIYVNYCYKGIEEKTLCEDIPGNIATSSQKCDDRGSVPICIDN